jgi:hypothetical protein
VNQTIFFILLRPIEAIIASISPIIDQESSSEKLFFADFLKKLIFGYIEQVGSLRSLRGLRASISSRFLKLFWLR